MKKKKLNKVFALGLVAVSLFTSLPVYAAETDDVQTVTQNASTSVTVSGTGSTFAVTVPKNVVGSGKSGMLKYSVTCSGNLAGDKQISVVPDETVVLSQAHKQNITGAIAQDKTDWLSDEFDVVGNGTVVYSGLSSGTWHGAFNFNIEIEDVVADATTLEAGLYDDHNNLVVSWEDSGIDVEANYTSSTYKTATTSPYYVLTNNYPTVTRVVIPDGVTSIGSYAFYYCENITDVVFPDSITLVGSNSFFHCSNLKSVKLNDGLTNLGYGAFFKCTSLVDVNIPDSLIHISSLAFKYTPWLTNLIASGNGFGVTDNGVLIDMSDSITGDVVIPDGVVVIGPNVFYNKKTITSVVFPDSVTTFEERVFDTCSKLKTVTLSDNMTYVGDYSFREVPLLTSVIYKGNAYNDIVITSASDTHTPALKSALISNGVTIGDYCFNERPADAW